MYELHRIHSISQEMATTSSGTSSVSPLLSKPRDELSEEIEFSEDNQTQPQISKFIQMNALIWHRVAAVSGIAAVGLGAFGTHVFKPQNPVYKEVWQTASLYHLSHSAALLAAPITKHPRVFGGCMTAGIVAFSGTCYLAAYLEDRKYSFLAPFGGFAFLAGWASLMF